MKKNIPKLHLLFAFLAVSLPLGAQTPTPPTTPSVPQHDIAPGPFKPTWESLEAGYQVPEWFRDAKFGIWAHWTAQCVPEQGDWYARNMYIQSDKNGKPTADYEFHVKTYGHPSKFGFKDIDNLWHAENWDPDKLMALYKKAGAHYFVALANHHDNLDMWNSAYQPWNSVNVGPHKDIVGIWEKAARKAGLPFGVTVHAARTWTWFNVSHGSDKTGPLAGVPYDGNLTKADGKGLWWDGLDPQDLYCRPHADNEKPDDAYVTKFFNRTKDLVDKYHPDLLYFDDTGLDQVHLDIVADYYNESLKWNDGKMNVVVNTKNLSPEQRKGAVNDFERGAANEIQPDAWQSETCIGNWHYSAIVFAKHQYKTAVTVEQTLCNVVSKNGNFLLNLPVKGDGTLDSDELKVLEDLANWMPVNGEAIFDTRPWKIYGESSPESNVASGMFNEGKIKYTSQDLRYTSKGDNLLYAFFLVWPEGGSATIKTLGKGAGMPLDKAIESVSLLGSPDKIKWTQDENGLHLTLPATSPVPGPAALKIVLK